MGKVCHSCAFLIDLLNNVAPDEKFSSDHLIDFGSWVTTGTSGNVVFVSFFFFAFADNHKVSVGDGPWGFVFHVDDLKIVSIVNNLVLGNVLIDFGGTIWLGKKLDNFGIGEVDNSNSLGSHSFP